MQAQQAVVRLALGALDQHLKGVGAELVQKLVGVLGVVELQDLHLHPCPAEHLDGPLGGVLAGGVVVIGHDDPVGVFADEIHLILCQSGALGGHGAVEAKLMAGDGVHGPLADDDIGAFRFLGQVHGVEELPLGEDQSLGGVDIFCLGVLVQGPAGKADHVAPQVDLGEHDPVAEAVVDVFAVLLGDGGQVGGDQLLLGVALLGHGRQEAVEIVRSEADAEFDHGGPVQAAPKQIGSGGLSGVEFQRFVIVAGRVLAELPKPLLFLILALVAFILGNLKIGALCKKAHRVGIRQALDVHDEVDDPAPLVAAEAVVHLLVGGHGKGGRLLPVEGAQAEVIGAAALELHVLAHHLVDGVAGDQLVEKRRRECHGDHLLSECKMHNAKCKIVLILNSQPVGAATCALYG